MLTGGLRTRAGMLDAMAAGVDVIGMARLLALEPDLSARLLHGRADAARPVRLAVGNKTLDSVIQGSWYQTQIDRMGQGLAPDADLGRALPLLRYFLSRQGTALDVVRSDQPETKRDPTAPRRARATRAAAASLGKARDARTTRGVPPAIASTAIAATALATVSVSVATRPRRWVRALLRRRA